MRINRSKPHGNCELLNPVVRYYLALSARSLSLVHTLTSPFVLLLLFKFHYPNGYLAL